MKAIMNQVSDLYAYAGIKTSYDQSDVERYGQEVVNLSIELAPGIIQYVNKLKSISSSIKNSKEGNILLSMIDHKIEYQGGIYADATICDLFKWLN